MAKVEIYTSMMCPYCSRAVRLLQTKNVRFEQIDVSMSSELRQTMRSRAGGRTSVPQIFIDDEHIGGCDDLFALESAGHLDALLNQSVSASMTLCVAALQYCASDDAAATLAHIEPLIAKAARTAELICLPEAASFLAASRAQLEDRAEWEDDSSQPEKAGGTGASAWCLVAGGVVVFAAAPRS